MSLRAAAFEKEAAPEGCFEDADTAFQLWLGARPPLFGGFGFLATPHVGVYGEDYSPFLPIVALSLPLVLSYGRVAGGGGAAGGGGGDGGAGLLQLRS